MGIGGVRMQDRFKFRATVKGYYYIDTPEKCEEIEPLIFLENIDVLDIGDIGISEEDLEIAIRKQYSDLQDIYVERMMENFRDNSNGVDTYITITPERIYQAIFLFIMTDIKEHITYKQAMAAYMLPMFYLRQ